MLLELRRYHVRGGHMDEMHDRMQTILLPMFAKNGLPVPLAIWDGNASETGSVMNWVMPWDSFEARDAAWARFRPLFYQARLAKGGDEFVSRTDLTLFQPWEGTPFALPPSGCELLWHVQPRIPYAGDFISHSRDRGFAIFERAGATRLLGIDLIFGALPYTMVISSWPDEAVRARALQTLPEQLASSYPSVAIEANRWETLDRAAYLPWGVLP